MVKANFMKQKYMIFCMAIVCMMYFCPILNAEISAPQMQKLDRAEKLLNQLTTGTGTAQDKIGLAYEILQLTSELAFEAKFSGNTELGRKTIEIVDKVAVALHSAIDIMPDPKDSGLLQTALNAAEAGSAATLNIAELARDTKNSELGQNAMSAVANLKQVFHILKVATQYVIHSSEDSQIVTAGETFKGRIEQVEIINQKAFDAAVAAGAKPPKQNGTDDTEKPPGWWTYKDLPLDDQRVASGM